MPNLNKVLLIGHMTRDPELRYTPGGTAVCEFGIAINRKWKGKDGSDGEETCFVDCSMWARRGEVVAEHFRKGDPIFLEGRLQLDQWENKEGQKRSKLKVVAESFEFLGGGKGGGKPERKAAPQQPRKSEDSPSYGDGIKDEDIPF